MQKLHELLEKSSPAYAKWHQHPHYSFHHFVVFIFVASIAALTSLQGIYALNLSYENDANALAVNSKAQNKQNNGQIYLLNAQLFKAVKQYEQANDSNSQIALDNLIFVAQNRKKAMLAEAENNPQEFLLASLPEAVTSKLPSQLTGIVEQETEVRGKLEVLHVDYENQQLDEFVYFLDDQSGERVNVILPKTEENTFLTGDYAKAKGFKLDNKLVLASDNDLVSTTVSAQISAGPTGNQVTMAMILTFTDIPSTSWTTAQAEGMLFNNSNSVDEYYRDSAYNKTNFSGDVAAYSLSIAAGSSCDYYSWAYAAESAATAAGVNLSNYNRKLFILPKVMPGCGWGGVSNVGGNPSRSWVTSLIVSQSEHELGHAIGMRHAASYSCGSQAIDTPSNCSLSEYGDPYDTMGYYNSYQINAAHKVQQTWLSGANVQTVSSSGIYSVYPLEPAASNVQVLKIKKPDTNENYYVEYRQKIGFDSGLPTAAVAGVAIHTWSGAQTKFLDVTPGDGSFTNAFLSDGATFNDPINGIIITQLSHDANSAVLQITYGPATCYPANPSVSVSPSSQNGAAGQILSYTLYITHNDSSSCDPTTFAVSAISLPSGFTFNGGSITVSPQSSGQTNFTIGSPAGTTDGSYVFTVSATDISQTSHSAQSQGTFVVFTDTVAPTVDITSPANNSKLGKGSKTNIKATASDNSGVEKMETYIDGKLVYTQYNSSSSYSWNTRKVSSGAHGITVKAYDTAGNVGMASIVVFK